jgi:hypothetical protein
MYLISGPSSSVPFKKQLTYVSRPFICGVGEDVYTQFNVIVGVVLSSGGTVVCVFWGMGSKIVFELPPASEI